MAGLYKIKTVAERSGFSATLLRAWERRYGFLEPERQPSGHRLYTDLDLRVLRAVKLLLDRGQSVGEVAALGRAELLRISLPPGRNDGLGQATVQVKAPTLDGELKSRKEALIAAVLDLQSRQARQLVEEAFSQGLAWPELRRFVTEVSHDIGMMWADGKLSVASEHLLSSLWKEQLHSLIQELRPSTTTDKVVVCAGFPDELHELGLLFLQYEFVAAGHDVVYLGPTMPFEDLDSVLTRLRPHLVCLTVTRVPVLQVHFPRFSELVQRHLNCRFLVGGRGVMGQEEKLKAVGARPWTGQDGTLEELQKELLGDQ